MPQKRNNQVLSSKQAEYFRAEWSQAITTGTEDRFATTNAERTEFYIWLNGDEIYCDEFLNIMRTLERFNQLSVQQKLNPDRRDALTLYHNVASMITSTGGSNTSMSSFVLNVSGIVKQLGVVGALGFYLYHSRPPLFSDQSHQIIFIHSFCAAEITTISEPLLTAKVLESPDTFTDSEILSCLARERGPIIIDLLAKAGKQVTLANAPGPKVDSIREAVITLTGLQPKGPLAEYFTTVETWYRAQGSNLALDLAALYPAPFGGPYFVLKQSR